MVWSTPRLEDALDRITDGFVVVDRAWQCVYANAAAVKMAGCAREDLLGRVLWEVCPALAGAALHGRAFDQQGPERFETHHAALDMWIEASLHPSEHGVAIVLHDVTERKKTELAVAANEARYRLIVETAEEGIWLADADYRTTFANARLAALLGSTPEAMLGRAVHEFVDERDLPELRRRIAERKSGVPAAYDIRMKGPGGRTRWCSVRVTAVRAPNGDFAGALGMLSDIEERKEFERALAESDRRKDEFLAMLAHELRNPLAPIRSALDLMQLRPDDRDLAARARDILERQVEHMTRLVDDLLDVSRITRGQINLRTQRVELAAVIARAIETVSPLIEHRHQTLRTSLPPEPIALDADPTRLSQVVSNLLHNAAKFTPERGHIDLIADREEGALRIRVKDDGVGMDREALDRIFEPFMQLDASLDRAHGGLGIGLTLVRRLVEMHGGTVSAASEGIGRGSELTVRLPLREAAAAPEARRSARQVAPLRVLVVDDNVDAAQMLAELLAHLGHTTRTAHDAPEALEHIVADPPHLALVDIGLPSMSGHELARRIRSEHGPERVKLVAVSGYAQEDDRAESRSAGFDAHLAKPVDVHTIRTVLAELFA